MNESSSVVVLLAAHNGMRWIESQIDSIVNQDIVDVDIYISVDKSNDGTFEWCSNLAMKNPNIQVLPYGGIFGGAAKNFYRLIKDVDFNRYDYVAFSDQDDIWDSSKLSFAIDKIKCNNLDAYSSDVIAFWSSGKEVLIKKSYPQKRFDYFFGRRRR